MNPDPRVMEYLAGRHAADERKRREHRAALHKKAVERRRIEKKTRRNHR